MRTDPLLRAVTARDAGLGLIRRFNRWLAAGAVATAALFSLLAAHAFRGHTVTTRGASSSSVAASQAESSVGAPQSPSSAGGSRLTAPAQAAVPAVAAPSPVVSGGS